jgi:hypothetical protein
MPTPFENIYIYHNLMYNNTSRGGLRTNEYVMNNVVVKNNIFWRNFPNIDKVGNAIVDNNLFNTGADARQYGTNARMVDNAGFVNESGKNFHLTDASPAINIGVSVPISTDYDGVSRPQGVGYDIGPYEYTDGSTIPTSVPSSTPTPIPSIIPSSTPTPTPTRTPTLVPINTPTVVPTITSGTSQIKRESVQTGWIRYNSTTSVSTGMAVPAGTDRL